jgi:EpsD family peptidyl-prolyl cis-trans isomerase
MNKQWWLAGLAIVLAALGGCGKNDDKKPASQVAAKVNSEEITVHQVNNVLARAQNVPPEAAARAKREIVERLVDQSLAKQQAIEKKLDRSPNVVQAIEAAKSEILARAYLQQVAAAQAKPTPEEVKKYYGEHPDLFSQRRLYMIEEIALAHDEKVLPELRQKAARAKSMQEIGEWLKGHEVQYMVNRGARAAEQIPFEILPKLAAMKDGEIQVLESAERVNVIRLVASKAAPVDEATAAPRIEQFLYARRSNEVIAEEMKRLKSHAKIEYVGEFAPASAGAAAVVPAQAGTQTVTPAQAGAQKSGDINVEKGVRGLR